ncbi:hypothetical protein IWW50_001482 [Coemansia erecta]|nr:hypothetical protein IWW50_001482 [Coemansia erecta]
MAKRSGTVNVEWDSPERKRLRNEDSMLYTLMTPHVPLEQACANTIVELLQQNHAVPLLRGMDAAVQLVQELKRLQSLNTPLARELFEEAYGRALDFVGDVVYKLQQTDRANRSGSDDELESVQHSFAGVYQYLVEIIAKHTECTSGGQPRNVTDQEVLLVALPLAVQMSCESKELAAYDVPLLSSLDACGPVLCAVGRSSARASLIALLLLESSYTEAYLPWMVRAYSWCLSKDPLLRPTAWALFPAFCHYMRKKDQDGYTVVVEKPRITVDDPAELVEVVANMVGFVACARAGGLQIRLQRAQCLQEWNDDDDEPSSDKEQQCVFGVLNSALGGSQQDMLAQYSVYSCEMCDSHRCSGQPGPSLQVAQGTISESSCTVTLSDWLSYWFIASNRQQEITSVRFVRSAVRFIGHAPSEDMALKSSPLGQAIIRRLSSSNGEIRLAARDAVLSYSQGRPWDSDTVAQTKQANRVETVQIMRKLVRELRGPSIIEEAFLLVAGGIGRAAKLSEGAMYEVLPYLIRYYCGSNVFLRAVAMEQLLAVSQTHQVPVAGLLSRFSESIACTLAGTLEQRVPPAPVAQCMQMLETTLSEFLKRFQAQIVPELFIEGNEAALKTVAGILDIRLPVLCVNQAASIFARIFLMDDQLMHEAMLRFVSLLSAESELDTTQVEVNIPSLLRSCSVKLIFNLVLALGEHDSILRKRARSAIATVQNILDSAAVEDGNSQGVATIVQQTTTNMRTMANSESPRSGGPAALRSATGNLRLASFLTRHILGVLAYMNELLRDTADAAESRSEHMRRKAVLAIGEMVTLLGAQAAAHANNVVASLAPTLSGSLADCALDAWVVLAENLQHAQLSADQINSLLVPLLAAFVTSDSNRPLVAKAVDRVVAQHRPAIKQHYALVCPVPEHPLLAASYATMQGFGRKTALRQRLNALAKLLEARDSTVVLCAAREMCALVQQNTAQITAWKAAFRPGEAHQSDAGHGGRSEVQADAAFISRILGVLRCASSVGGPLGEVAAAACAACIGSIGVVDVQVLDKGNDQHQEPHGPADSQPVLHDLNGDEDERVEFVCTLLVDYLSRAFAMAPSPSVQMFMAYSIQELLRLAGFTKELLASDAEPDAGSKSAKRKKADSKRHKDKGAPARAAWLRQRWEMLPTSVVETVWPLLDSKYTIQSSSRATAGGGARMACVKNSTSYVGWLRAWIVELTNGLTAPAASGLFRACLGAVKEGPAELLRFVLPQVVYQYSTQRQGSAGDSSMPIVVDDDADDSGGADAVVDELLAVLAYDVDEVRMAADQLRQCRIAALELLDVCDGHVRAQQQQRTAGKRSSRRDTRATAAEKAVQRVAAAVPCDVVARAAAACGQYERAVQSTELWQRERSGYSTHATQFGHVDDAVMAQLQDLHFRLDDVDGMAGAEQCRAQEDRGLTVRRHEIEGNWAYALIGHETQLRMEPDSKDVQRRWVECLQNMGQWEGAWTAARSLTDGQGEGGAGGCSEGRARGYSEGRAGGCSDGLRGACYAAAWRLGKWDWVEQAGAVDVHAPFDAASSALLLGVGRGGLSGLDHLAQPVALDRIAQPVALNQGPGQLARAMDMALRVAGRDIGRAGAAQHVAAEVHAHMLGDLALAAAQLGADSHDCAAVGALAEQWRVRVSSLPATYAAQEPVLALHARVYAMMGAHCPGCECVARRAAARTRLQAAQLALLGGSRATTLGVLAFAEAEADAGADTGADVRAWLQIERAQVLWQEGHAAAAIAAARRVSEGLGVQVRAGGDSDSESEAGSAVPAGATRSAFARATLLLTQWQEATNAVGSSQLLAQYERVLRAHESDRAHYALARLYDRMFAAESQKDGSRMTEHQSMRMAALQYYMVRHYSRTVMYSARYLYRALPRLLTVWLDFGTNILQAANSRVSQNMDRFRAANRMVTNLSRRVPAYNFLVVLAQLASRICHANEDVFKVLESILLNVLSLYPQQALWQLVGVQRSTYAVRAERCAAVLGKARAAGAGELVQQASRLTDLLLALCNSAPARSVTAMHMSKDFRALARAVPLDVVVPLQRCLTPAVPDAGSSSSGGSSGDLALSAAPPSQGGLYQPFAGDLPTIAGFDDAIDVMHSLQRPKKITVVGSDGQRYSFLCKPKDDLRKDARLMEFNAMINQLLGADTRARARQLRIRTYAVVPLNEECGLIEWVPATVGVRHVLLRLYSARNITVSMAQAKSLLDAAGAEPEKQFTEQVLPRFPSVLHEWFVRQFGSPCAWLAARTAFTRSAAVMSVVGHVLGLGDRHCENILLDERAGGVVHVDFNCLFDKGLQLEKPERVPFRLTHNMVDAMGLAGYEGAFRRSCELTLALLREHRDALMSVLESFLHDPLVEWSRRSTRASSRAKDAAVDAQPNEHASRHLSTIRKKLQGNIQGSAGLSVEGYVDELITQATDPKRLCQMYVGWAPFM